VSNLTIHEPAAVVGNYNGRQESAVYSQPAQGDEQFGLVDILRVLGRHRLLLTVIIGSVTLATLVWQLLSPTLYQATSMVQVELIDNVGTNQADMLARNAQRVANEVKIHRSRSAAERVVKDLKLYDRKDFIVEMGGKVHGTKKKKVRVATSTLMGMTNIESEESSDLIEVTVTSRSPELAALIANRYPVTVQRFKMGKIADRREVLLASLTQEQNKRAKEAVAAAQKLADFRREHAMLVGAAGPEDLAQINRIAAEAASAAALRAGSSAQSAGVARAAAMTTTAGATSAPLQQLQRQEAELSAEKARLSQTFGPGHPDVIRTNGQLAEVRTAMAREEAAARSAAAAVAAAEGARTAQMARSEAAGAAARAGTLAGVVSQLTSKAYRNTADSVQLDKLTQEADVASKAFTNIAERVQQVRAQMKEEGLTTSVVSQASPDNDAVAPEPMKMTALAFLGSSLFALLLAFAVDLFDNRLRTIAQVRRLFGLSTFGMLPMMNEGVSEKLQESPVLQDPQSLFAEVARSTYTEVRSLGVTGKTLSVLVTSPLPGDGKSVVTLTLAAAAMAAGQRVVILDLDLRKASILQQMQRATNTPDLIDVLKGRVDLKLVAAPNPPSETTEREVWEGGAVDETRFALLSVTKPVAEPAALLSSGKMEILIDDLKSKFDIVIVNAPAALAVRDAQTMCEFTDQTLLVARWGHTTIDQMRATLEMLGHANVAGVVFNQVDYAEHARRRYGDAIQFYYENSDYYSGSVPRRRSLIEQIKRLLPRRRRRLFT
jgi:polysaccharide biosynthesis transport protein